MKIWTVNPEIPKNAGKAKIEWVDPGYDDRPSRKGNIICLPAHNKAEFYKLAWGVQFLFVLPGRYSNERSLYFGGTDEEPFLVGLQPHLIDKYKEGGDKAFYNTLKPSIIGELEQEMRVESERQGDIFAIPLPMSWEALIMSQKFYAVTNGGDEWEDEPTQVKAKSLFGTRHLFSGTELNVSLEGRREVMVGQGIVEAPDHADLVLDRVYLFAQTAFLFNPKQAD